MATDVSFWFMIEPTSHYHLISELHQSCCSGLHQKNSYNRSHSCLIHYRLIFTSYCTSPHTNIQQKLTTVNWKSWRWRSPFMLQAWRPDWGASGIAMTVWDRTTTPWSFWGRTTSVWEPSAFRAGGCSRIVCSLAVRLLWDLMSSARDPPRRTESAGWGRRWERDGGQWIICWSPKVTP